MSDRRNISIIGAGLMGHAIVVVFARAGHAVTVHDSDVTTLRSLLDRASTSLSTFDLTTDDHDAALARIGVCETLANCVSDAHFVIEAAPENLPLKQQIFAQLEDAAPATCILASNTSVIPITKIVQEMDTKERALGTHWWNPPHMIPLVEVVRTQWTGERAINDMMELLHDAGKSPVRVEKDVPGFIGNRLQHALWREAISLVENGVCDAASVDAVINASFGRRLAVLGPLANADLVGTDLTLAIHQNVLSDLDRSQEPSPYLERLVRDGKLGAKSGQGFHSWTDGQADELKKQVSEHLKKLETILN